MPDNDGESPQHCSLPWQHPPCAWLCLAPRPRVPYGAKHVPAPRHHSSGLLQQFAHHTCRAIAHHRCLQPPWSNQHHFQSQRLTCLSMALCTCGSDSTIIAGDFQHQLHEHVGTQHPPAAHQPCCWAGGFHAQQRLCFAPFASHLGGGLLDHMWARLHHTWPLVKQIPFVKEAWFSDHLAVGCEHQLCRLL